MTGEIKIDMERAAAAASGQFSGAAHMKQLLGDKAPAAVKPKAAVKAEGERGEGAVPYGDERYIEGIVAQLGSA